MYQHKLERDIRCPLDYALGVFGGKWKSRILCVLARKKVLRYSEIRTQMGNITDAVLSAALKELITDHMVFRQSYDEVPPRVEYCLTERGASIIPILQSIAQWAGACDCDEAAPGDIQCSRCNYRAQQQNPAI